MKGDKFCLATSAYTKGGQKGVKPCFPILFLWWNLISLPKEGHGPIPPKYATERVWIISKHFLYWTISFSFHVKTACTIATSLIHSKLDYCNSLYLNSQQLNRLQLIHNCCSCCHKNSKIPSHYSSSQITSLAQNRTTHTIQNSLTSHFSTTNLPPFLILSPHNQLVLPAPLQLIVTLQRPSNSSRLKISNRSFYFQAPAL